MWSGRVEVNESKKRTFIDDHGVRKLPASICRPRTLLLIATKTRRERLDGNVTCRKAVIRETARRTHFA